MKTSNIAQTWSKKTSLPSHQPVGLQRLGWLLTFGVGLFAAASVQAASDTWTNAPVDNTWVNTNNWVGHVVPGALNQTGNSVNNDVATFNSPIFGTIGEAANPIMPDDATINNDRSRSLGSIIFDTANCGAYVFNSTSPAVLPTATNPETGILNLCHNGSVTMNATVTNSETFLVPIFIRLPSSTAGIYHFVNNSTTPTATLFINVVTNNSANTRGTVFTLDGSNTGTNTILELSKGTTTSGAMGLTKQGTGTWILPDTNDLASQSVISINAGLLIVKDPGVFGVATSATVNSNGTLEIDGVTLGQSRLNLLGQGTIRVNGSATVNGVSVGTATGINASLATTSSGDVMTVLTNSGGAVDSVLHVTGPGTVLLSGLGSYAGNWSFDTGACQISDPAALGTGPMASVSAGGTLDLTPLGAVTYAWTPAGLGGNGTGTAVGSTAATIKADPAGVIDLASGANNISLIISPASASGDTTHPAVYISQGTLSLGNNVFSIDNASGTPLGVGTYTLIAQASGNVTSAGGYSVAEVTGNGLAANTIGVIQVSGGNVNLVVESYVAQNLVWQGGNPNNNWDNGTTANWLNGASPSVFTTSDKVTFNSTGSANPIVNLVGVLSPGSVTVDTTANNYTLSGSGKIGGATGLTKTGTGTLIVQTTNIYAGDTVINNGTLQLGGSDVIPGIATSGQVVVQNPGVLDLNTFSDTIGSLDGNGAVDCTGGGTSTLTVGNNNSDGTFSGVIQNTSGTLGLTKVGAGTQTLSAASTYTGPTALNSGTLKAGNVNALGAGTNALTINGGVLDLASDLNVGSLAGAAGTTIANNSTATINTLTVGAPGATIYSGNIVDGSGGGAVAVRILNGAALTFAGANTYSGGTIVGSGSTFAIPNGPTAFVGGSVIASNGATLSLTGGSTTPGTPTNITTVDGGTVTFSAGAEGKIWQCQFVGGPNTTNLISTTMSFGQPTSFQNFLGVVDLEANGNVRFFDGGGVSGGDNTTFFFSRTNAANVHVRDAQSVSLGAITGGGPNSGIGGQGTTVATYLLGAKGVDTSFEGYISGSNNIVKTGAGTLMLDGGGQFITNVTQVGLFFVTNIGFGTNMLIYVGSTTVSNGVLALAVPSELTNSTPVTLAGASAVLDASDMGYITNQVTTDGNGNTVTNQFPVTNSLFEVVSGQTLQGMGTLKGNLVADAGSAFNVGLPVGSFIVTGNAELAGTVTMNVNATTTPSSSELMAPGFTIDPTASLVVTNLGTEAAATFQLFNHAVNFASVTLPTLSGTNSWINNLSVNGSITLVAPPATTPTITQIGVSGTTLTITATNGTVNGRFELLESTNLATPLVNWTPVLTNTFDGSGNLNLSTNIVDPAVPREFFILSQ